MYFDLGRADMLQNVRATGHCMGDQFARLHMRGHVAYPVRVLSTWTFDQEEKSIPHNVRLKTGSAQHLSLVSPLGVAASLDGPVAAEFEACWET